MDSTKHIINFRLTPVSLSINVLLWGFIVSLIGLSSCSNQESVSFVSGSGRFRVFNAQTRTNTVNIEVDSIPVISQLIRGSLSEATSVDSDYGREIAVDFIGGDTTFNIPRQRYVFAKDQSYTIVLQGNTIAGFMKPIIDTTQSPFGQDPAIRIINATESKYILIALDQDTLTGSETEFGSSTQLFRFRTGTFEIKSFDTETDETLAKLTASLQAGKCYHLFLYDTRQSGISQELKLVEVVK
jgi:hypothetical protein